MKTILLPLESGDGLQSMLKTAWLAATAFGGVVRVNWLEPGRDVP